MAIDKKFYIHTGKDGILEDTSDDDVRALVADLKSASKLVLHLHGGLIKKSAALEKVERLTPAYQAAGARPVFMVWESGFLETITNNLNEINKEKIFSIIVRRVLKYGVGKMLNIEGSKASGQLPLPKDIEVNTEFNKRLGPDGEVPYNDFRPLALDEVTETERKRFEDSLATDTEFQNEVQAIVDSTRPEEIESTSKGVTARRLKSTSTLISPEVVDELVADAAEKEGKGIFSSAAMILKAGQVLWRVLDRFRHNRDHGLYATVVEEVLREFYVANIGSFVWGAMKKDTEDTFANVGQQPTRAGWFFVQELGALMKHGHRPEVSVIAHSAGAIYASHLLVHLAWARADQKHPLPHDFRLKNLVFLAPACTFRLFDRALAAHRQAPLFDHFRMFALRDELEAGYWEIPAIYPRSLLYFVSGVVERENGKGAEDLPLVGMQRYFIHTETYRQPEVERVRDLLGAADRRSEVWSEANDGNGLWSDAVKHGGFDSTEDRKKTIESVQYILKSGW
jgi:pimeloyl-ACP methyl ester carboxylesterase